MVRNIVNMQMEIYMKEMIRMATIHNGFTQTFERMHGVLHRAVSAQYSHAGLVEKGRLYSDFLFAYQILELEAQHEGWNKVIRNGVK